MTSNNYDVGSGNTTFAVGIDGSMVPEMVEEKGTQNLNRMRAWATVAGIKDVEGGETLLTSLAPLSPSLEVPTTLKQDTEGQQQGQILQIDPSATSSKETNVKQEHNQVIGGTSQLVTHQGFLVDEETCLEEASRTNIGVNSTTPILLSPTGGLFSSGFNHTQSSLLHSPDANTQLSLIQRSEQLQLDDPLSAVETSNSLWENIIQEDDGKAAVSSDLEHPDPEDDDGRCKALKATRISDAPSSVQGDEDAVIAFDADGASSVVSSENFVFTKFGSDVSCVLTFGNGVAATNTQTVTSIQQTPRPSPSITTSVSREKDAATNGALNLMETATDLNLKNTKVVKNNQNFSKRQTDPMKDTHTINESDVKALSVPTTKALSGKKSGTGSTLSLNTNFPSRAHGRELKILVQPENQHRARYMTEGSRGAVKDQSQKGFPTVAITGINERVKLQVFVGTDKGKILPHGFYQAIKVCSKNSTECTELNIEGTTVVELNVEPSNDMQALIDCVGILKLRNADVEQRVGVARVKKKSTRVRMVFRAFLPKPDGSTHQLQVASMPISCTQPAGQPEICRQSLKKCTAKGGEELFIIGKNFTKPTQVIIQQLGDDPKKKKVPTATLR